LAYKVTS